MPMYLPTTYAVGPLVEGHAYKMTLKTRENKISNKVTCMAVDRNVFISNFWADNATWVMNSLLQNGHQREQTMLS